MGEVEPGICCIVCLVLDVKENIYHTYDRTTRWKQSSSKGSQKLQTTSLACFCNLSIQGFPENVLNDSIDRLSIFVTCLAWSFRFCSNTFLANGTFSNNTAFKSVETSVQTEPVSSNRITIP